MRARAGTQGGWGRLSPGNQGLWGPAGRRKSQEKQGTSIDRELGLQLIDFLKTSEPRDPRKAVFWKASLATACRHHRNRKELKLGGRLASGTSIREVPHVVQEGCGGNGKKELNTELLTRARPVPEGISVSQAQGDAQTAVSTAFLTRPRAQSQERECVSTRSDPRANPKPPVGFKRSLGEG